MSIVKLAENVEIEKQNNQAFKAAMIGSYDSQIAQTEALLTGLKAARENAMQEFDNRYAALGAIIGE
jgi:hypothetical protein